MVEVVASSALIGLMLVAALSTVSASRMGTRKTADHSRGMLLAQQLLEEILAQSYEEPVDPPSFGRESGESAVSRAAFDDVDDYHGWSASPPQYKDGTVAVDLSGWQRSVIVERVKPTDLSQVVFVESGAKRITVRVARDDVDVGSLLAIRTAAGPDPDDTQ
jgi:hypothetical protein